MPEGTDEDAAYRDARDAEMEQALNHSLRAKQTDEEAQASCRILLELRRMLAVVEREKATMGRSWTWHLLATLDWENEDDGPTETGLMLGLHDDERPIGDASEFRAELLAREKRLKAALRAFEIAMPDLLRSPEPYRGPPTFLDEGWAPISFPADVYRALDLIDRALQHCEMTQTASRILARIPRGRNELRAAALRMIKAMHQLDSDAALARLVDRNVEGTTIGGRFVPAPCPVFAASETSEKIRQVFARSAM